MFQKLSCNHADCVSTAPHVRFCNVDSEADLGCPHTNFVLEKELRGDDTQRARPCLCRPHRRTLSCRRPSCRVSTSSSLSKTSGTTRRTWWDALSRAQFSGIFDKNIKSQCILLFLTLTFGLKTFCQTQNDTGTYLVHIITLNI